MAKFLLVYHGGGDGAPSDEEMAAWGGWFETLGNAVVDGGAPIAETKTLSPDSVADGGGANPATGYSLIEAADMDDALAKAKSCPVLAAGGTIEVCTTIDLASGASNLRRERVKASQTIMIQCGKRVAARHGSGQLNASGVA